MTNPHDPQTGASALPPHHLGRLILGAVVAFAFVALIAAGCSGDAGTDQASPTSAAGVDLSGVDWVDHSDEATLVIQTRDNSFRDDYVIVKAGTPVTFSNVGRNDHNALPADGISFVGIETEDLKPGSERVIVFDEPGDYPFYCSLHGTTTRGMVGAVRVVA